MLIEWIAAWLSVAGVGLLAMAGCLFAAGLLAGLIDRRRASWDAGKTPDQIRSAQVRMALHINYAAFLFSLFSLAVSLWAAGYPLFQHEYSAILVSEPDDGGAPGAVSSLRRGQVISRCRT